MKGDLYLEAGIGTKKYFIGDVVSLDPIVYVFNRRKLFIFDSNVALDYTKNRVSEFVDFVKNTAAQYMITATMESFIPSMIELVISNTDVDAQAECLEIIRCLQADGIQGRYDIVGCVIADIISNKEKYVISRNDLANLWTVVRAVHKEVEFDSSVNKKDRFYCKVSKLGDCLIGNDCFVPLFGVIVAAIFYYLYENPNIYNDSNVQKKIHNSLSGFQRNKNQIPSVAEKDAACNFAMDISMYYMMSRILKQNIAPVFVSGDYIFKVLLQEIGYALDDKNNEYGVVINPDGNVYSIINPLISSFGARIVNESTITQIDQRRENLKDLAESYLMKL